ncbi:MAG: hypothetical protein LBE67_17840 [Kocuria palustris]|uniref:hypothetical protein n=1 Tax=Kocuria palustris TaxID=71999 RepID=UPI001D750F47|nr:hypothetical protein [Kocuria palustris]MBZ6376769.1 hypothetical protein [Kocuria palustris]
MPTTITLTPTLTLSVGDRRMPQQRVEDVWSSIAQHTRATDRPATIAVMDGSETLRVWELRPDGSKALLDHESLEAPDFRLLLSPWTMAVPLDNGPDHREVSTLAVAHAQAEEAARAGAVEIVLQTIGTDLDAAETIDPSPTDEITAQQEVDDVAADDDDLMDDLSDDNDVAAQAKTKKRRRLVLGSSAAAVLVLAGLGLGTHAMLTNDEPAAAPAPETQAPEEAGTEDPATPAPIQNQAIAPAGFSGTPTWEVVGATDQSSGLTWDGEHIGAISNRALDIVAAEDGEITDSLTLPAALDSTPRPLRDGAQGGLLLLAEGRVMTWSQDHGLVDSKISDDDRLIVRGGTAFTVPQRDDVRPDEIRVVTTDGLKKYTSPSSSASPIGPAHNAGYLWASSAEGGSLIHAEASGKEISTTRLIGPSDDATISQWLGATNEHAAVIWSEGSTGVIAIHDAESGQVVETHDLTSSSSSMQVVPSSDGQQLLAGTTPIDLDMAQIGSPVGNLSTSNRAIIAVPGGWIATQTDGTSVLISPDGSTTAAPSSAEDLLGLADPGDIVVDHRGALAAFAPDSSD